MSSYSVLRTVKSFLLLFWRPTVWKEQAIVAVHTIPFILAAVVIGELLGYSYVWLGSTMYVIVTGADWLMGQWYDGEVFGRAG